MIICALLCALYDRVAQLIGKLFHGRKNGPKTADMAKITLYINGKECDLPKGEALLLFTYQFSDLEQPAAVLNSYSREITLPPTERNNRLFAQFYRPDSTGFDPLQRIPFLLRGADGTNMESGYVKFNSASARDGYAVQLFGGLGGFFYGLMYNEDGGKKSLASLDYGTDLAFSIDAATVGAAWDALDNGTPDKWRVINFAPMAQGVPEGDFDASHAVVPVGSAKCPAVAGESGKGGLALVDLGKEFTEWDVRDLRSYLQRPVFNTGALLDALGDEGNNGGYTFKFSGSFADRYVPWLVLPALTSINFSKKSGSGSVSYQNLLEPNGHLYPGTLTGASEIPAGAAVGAKWSGGLDLQVLPDGTYKLRDGLSYSVIFVQLVAFDSNDVAVNGSDVLAVYPYDSPYQAPLSPAAFAKKVGYTPDWGKSFRRMDIGTFTASSGVAEIPGLALEVPAAYGVDHFGLRVWMGTYRSARMQYTSLQSELRVWKADGTGNGFDLFHLGEASGTYSYESADKVRSGSYIDQAALLGGTASPAEYLLALAKLYGWVFTYDRDTRTVSVVDRSAFFDGDTLNVADRIDRRQAYTIRPNIIEAKWLEFTLQDSGTDWAQQYKDKYGAQYGAQRVNTGSPFNRDTEAVLEGTPFKAPVGCIPYGRYFYIVTDGGTVIPAPWLDNGIKYTLWNNGTQEASEHEVAPVTALAQLTPLPTDEQLQLVGPGYDAWARLQAHDADGKPVDVTGTLVLFDATGEEHVNLTDDTPAMLNATGGAPCWRPNLDGPGSEGLRIPYFLPWAFEYSRTDSMQASLDVGQPREVDAPKFWYRPGTAIYDRRWAAFIEDRYNADARVCTCRVRWAGLQVGPDLLRHFYWFDGCRWVLNKIGDWEPGTDAPVECEFVKVGDAAAYTGGQS